MYSMTQYNLPCTPLYNVNAFHLLSNKVPY
nr:MAG TPA: hypothetical protein [Caudoviricetes sp.]